MEKRLKEWVETHTTGYPPLALFADTSVWPAWPLLPIKHTTLKDPAIPGFPATAILADDRDFHEGRINVYAANLWAPSFDKILGTYSSLEAVEAAGWRID